jgi:ferrous iron transport protein A
MKPKRGARKRFSLKDMRSSHRRSKIHWHPFHRHHRARVSSNLSGVQSGESVQIRRMDGGHQFLSRLASLGFTPGARLQVVQNYGHGPIIVRLRDTRVALGRGEANKILVQEAEEDGDGR